MNNAMYDNMQRWMQDIVGNMHLTDYKIGTVLQVNPIKIDFGDNKKITDIGTNILYTEAVLEKKLLIVHSHIIPQTTTGLVNAHTHPVPSWETEDAQENTYTITEGIAAGDKLLMLSVERGQKWIVLSKIRNSGSVTISAAGWDWS